MTTFILEIRMQKLEEAFAAAQEMEAQFPGNPELQARTERLAFERELLNAAPDEDKDDAAFRSATILWARTLESANQLISTLSENPVYLALGTPPTTNSFVAKAVVAHPNRPSIWGSTLTLTSQMVVELEHEGHRWWLNQPQTTRPPLSDANRPLNDVAILTPVNIETRFYPPGQPLAGPDNDPTVWRVRVRVTPDEISINRHRPKPTSFEKESLASLRKAWHGLSPDQTLAEFLTQTETGRAQWLKLCNAFTPPRAAWLIYTNAPNDLQPAEVDDEEHPLRVDGFPAHLEVWIVRSGRAEPEKIGESEVTREGLVFNLPKDDSRAWWNSWEQARELGIGLQCILPGEPDEIQTLYVLGLSEDSPASFFADRIAAGDFVTLEPGVPTNTIHGEPAADLGQNPKTWEWFLTQALSMQSSNISFQSKYSRVLTGHEDGLPLFPEPDFDPDRLGAALVGALYPSLWGHAFKDIWGWGKDSHALVPWMVKNVRPLGHLLPVRVNDLPYGLVPATSLKLWQSSPAEGREVEVEALMLPVLQTLQARFAVLAEARGTTFEADTEKLVALLARTPTSTGYSYQPFIASELMENLMNAFAGGLSSPELQRYRDEVLKRYDPGHELSRGPAQRYYVAYGHLRDIGMPLIVPTRFPGDDLMGPAETDPRTRIQRLVEILDFLLTMSGVTIDTIFELLHGVLPDSLLFRLLFQSAIHAKADAAQAGLPSFPDSGDGPRLEPLINFQEPETWLWSQIFGSLDSPDPRVDLSTAAAGTLSIMTEGLREIIKMLSETLDGTSPGEEWQLHNLIRRMELLFKNTLDTAATRIDPFVTGMAWRRLNMLSNETTTRHRMGVYGWVDFPKRGQHGPKPGRLLHAPSYAQLATAIILRDRYLRERGLDGANGRAWQMSITSQRARMADELAEEVRMGAHLREALGRRVEAILNDPVVIKALRVQHAPLRSAAPDSFTVCDGEKVLKMFQENTLPPLVAASLTNEKRARLQELQDALDVYADLLVAQGIYFSMSRRAAAASGTMNAASGFALPPELEVIQTPRAGQSVMSSVLVVLPFVPSPAESSALSQAHPSVLADASVAAYIEDQFGPTSDWKWSFQIKGIQIVNPGEEGEVQADFEMPREVSLVTLGLTVMDAVLFPPDRLESFVKQMVIDEIADSVGNLVQVDIASNGVLSRPDVARHRQAREVVAVLGGRPFEFGLLNVTVPEDAAGAMVLDSDEQIRQELRRRLDNLVAAAKELVEDNQSQPADTLLRSARWGITPLDATLPAVERAVMAKSALSDRLQKAEAFLEGMDVQTNMPNSAGKASVAPVAQIAEAISQLASPEGGLAILSNVVETAELQNNDPAHPIRPTPQLDEEWLTVLAPVRSRLARLEALQLAPLFQHPPVEKGWFAPCSNRPGDLWQQEAVALNRERVRQGQAMQPSRLVVAYGPENVWSAQQVAVGVIDSWGESVPEPRQTTQAAFNFNAPGARAPQAVLLATPPVVDQLLDIPTLLEIVCQTRELTHARMVTLEDLGSYEAVLPLMLLSTPNFWDRVLLNDNPFFIV